MRISDWSSDVCSSDLLRKEALVPGDQHVREGQQPREHVVLDDLRRQVLEEEIRLLLVHVEGEPADPAALQPLDGGARVDDGTSADGTSVVKGTSVSGR